MSMDDGYQNEDSWVPDVALESLIAERTIMYPGETNVTSAKRIIDHNLPLVTHMMVHLAVHSKSERTRLESGKYLIDRALGRVGAELADADAGPIADFISQVTEFANGGK